MPATLIVLVCLATFRLTRLLTDDAISLPIRERLEPRPMLGYLVTCRWCASIWAGALLAGLAAALPESQILWAALLALSASAVAGLLSRLDQ